MSGETLKGFAELIRRETGIVIKEPQHAALDASLARIAPEASREALLAQLSDAPAGPLWRRLVDEVTVSETYFLREPRDLRTIGWRDLLAANREAGLGLVRVWVAGCSSGEEAYTLAILASEALADEATPVSILATDISAAALARAEAGADYSERSVRQLAPALRECYLTREGGHYRVKKSLRQLVRFRQHNLVADPAPPLGETPFDLIACRNVLIYFERETVVRVLGSLEAALRPGGLLILGSADRLTTVGLPATGAGAGRERRRRTSSGRRLRRPLGLEPRVDEERAPPQHEGGPRRRREDRIEDALLAADAGELDAALGIVEALLASDPLLADAHFVRGLVELERAEAQAAVVSLRRCLYLDPGFGLAAFELGRAHDALGDARAGRRAYEQALRSLEPSDGRHRAILDLVDLGDVAEACAARLRADVGSAR